MRHPLSGDRVAVEQFINDIPDEDGPIAGILRIDSQSGEDVYRLVDDDGEICSIRSMNPLTAMVQDDGDGEYLNIPFGQSRHRHIRWIVRHAPSGDVETPTTPTRTGRTDLRAVYESSNIDDKVLLRATVYDTPDPDSDEPNDRFYTLAIEPTASSGGRDLVTVYERDLHAVVAPNSPPTGGRPAVVTTDHTIYRTTLTTAALTHARDALGDPTATITFGVEVQGTPHTVTIPTRDVREITVHT